MREFRGSVVFLVTLYSLLSFFTLAGLALFILLVTGQPMARGFLLLIPWTALSVWLWLIYIHLPFLITYQDNRFFEFKSFFRVVTLSPGEIQSVRRLWGLPWFLELRYAGGKLVMTTQMSDLAELLALFRKENPLAEIQVD